MASLQIFGGCEDAPIGVPIFSDQARLRVPLQVYPEQPFYLDATQSSQSQGEIKGFIFNVGDQTPELIVTDPRLAYQYDTEGVYAVSVRLIDGNSLQQASIEVVSCGQPLACEPPTRPCPSGYLCETQGDVSVCVPEQPVCSISAQCPSGTTCIQGVCAYGGPCAPVVEPLPGGPCVEHSECGASAFCVNQICEVLACDEACLSERLASTELLNIPGDNRITGIAAFYAFADGFFFLSLDGTSFRHTANYVNGIDLNISPALRPDETPAQFIGTAALEAIGTGLSGSGARWDAWGHLDILPPLDANNYAIVQFFNFSLYTANVPVVDYFASNQALFSTPLGAISALTSEIGPDDVFGSNPEWFHDVSWFSNSFYEPFTATSTSVLYTPSVGAFSVYIDVSGEISGHTLSYLSGVGVEVCAVATDGRYVFAAENRVARGLDGQPVLGAGRLLQFSIETGELIETWPSVIGATCALEADPITQTLVSVQYTTRKAPFLAVYRYQ